MVVIALMAILIGGMLIFVVTLNDSRSAEIEATALHARKLAHRLNVQAINRRDQNCVLFERNYISSLKNLYNADKQLDETIAYLRALSPEEKTTSINKLFAGQIAAQRVDVENLKGEIVKAPKYCYDDNTGLEQQRVRNAERKYAING